MNLTRSIPFSLRPPRGRYGWFATKDIFVWGPNLTGLMLGLAQLALKLAFPSKK